MARGHLFRLVTDPTGTPLYGAQVTVRTADVSAPIAQTVWDGPLNTANDMGNPFIINGGYVDIWLDQPQRINLLIESPNQDPIAVYVDVQPSADEAVYSPFPLQILNAPTVAGQVLVATSVSTALFQDPPVTPPAGTVAPHNHPGTGTDSTALGTGNSASGTRSVAVGDSSAADFDDASAFGYQATAGGQGAVAFGSGATVTDTDGVAVGHQANAGAGSAAVGAQAQAPGARAVAIGQGAVAAGQTSLALGTSAYTGGVDSVAVGQGANAQGVQSAAVGAGASANFDGSTVIGRGAMDSDVNQVVLGQDTDTVVIPGALIAQGNGSIGAPGTALGFFGTTPTGKVAITGADGGNLALRALIAYLSDATNGLGLFVNQTTQG